MESLTEKQMRDGLGLLDQKLNQKLTLILGGGGAMVLAYHFPLSTMDLDAIAKGMDLSEISSLIREVAEELHLPSDWINPHFSSFIFSLPDDYGDRLTTVFEGANLTVEALGREDLLIMKCFAHRNKDIGHALALIKSGADLNIVETQIEKCINDRIPGSQEAIDFLDDLLGQLE
ncbi:MAG: DUF6036 family nucleotidyltransferase [Bdellovibrionota bacterium]